MFFNGRFKAARFKAFKVLSLPPIIREKPSWITESDLGSIDEETEVLIVLEYHDPFAEIERFTYAGDLPSGLIVNEFDGSISGSAEISQSASYSFSVSMHTTTGEVFTRNFTLFVIANDTEVVWKSTSDLGEVDSGVGYQTIIKAEQVKK